MKNIFVELDLRDGLLDIIDIVAGGMEFKKILDYVKIPLRWSLCEVYGNLKNVSIEMGEMTCQMAYT